MPPRSKSTSWVHLRINVVLVVTQEIMASYGLSNDAQARSGQFAKVFTPCLIEFGEPEFRLTTVDSLLPPSFPFFFHSLADPTFQVGLRCVWEWECFTLSESSGLNDTVREHVIIGVGLVPFYGDMGVGAECVKRISALL